MKTRLPLTLLLSALFLANGWLCADTIDLKNGKKKLKITIVEETIEKVTYRKGTLPPQSVSSSEVKEVRYSSGASDFKTANEAFANGDFGPSADLFTEYADGLSGDKEALRAYCMFMVGTCYQKAGMWKESINAFTRFANDYPQHRLYPNALRSRAVCYLNMGEARKASTGFKTLEDAVSKKKLSDYWKNEVKYWQIYLKEKSDSTRALKDYQDLYKAVKDKYPDVANQARLRIGMVMITQKKYTDAHSFFSDIIDQRLEASRDAAAGAYLGRGKCVLNKRGVKKAEYKEALFDLLHVVVHYADVGTYQAEALYLTGKCFLLAGGTDAAKRSQSMFRKVKNDWPGTKWATEATRELGG